MPALSCASGIHCADPASRRTDKCRQWIPEPSTPSPCRQSGRRCTRRCAYHGSRMDSGGRQSPSGCMTASRAAAQRQRHNQPQEATRAGPGGRMRALTAALLDCAPLGMAACRQPAHDDLAGGRRVARGYHRLPAPMTWILLGSALASLLPILLACSTRPATSVWPNWRRASARWL